MLSIALAHVAENTAKRLQEIATTAEDKKRKLEDAEKRIKAVHDKADSMLAEIKKMKEALKNSSNPNNEAAIKAIDRKMMARGLELDKLDSLYDKRDSIKDMKVTAATEILDTPLLSNAQEAAELFNKEIVSIFGNSVTAKARVRNLLGYSLDVSFANISPEKATSNLNVQNATAHMTFMMHLSKNSKDYYELGDKLDLEQLQCGWLCRKHNIKFRKISAKSPVDAIKKLLAWFKANKEAIESLPEKG